MADGMVCPWCGDLFVFSPPMSEERLQRITEKEISAKYGVKFQ